MHTHALFEKKSTQFINYVKEQMGEDALPDGILENLAQRLGHDFFQTDIHARSAALLKNAPELYKYMNGTSIGFSYKCQFVTFLEMCTGRDAKLIDTLKSNKDLSVFFRCVTYMQDNNNADAIKQQYAAIRRQHRDVKAAPTAVKINQPETTPTSCCKIG